MGTAKDDYVKIQKEAQDIVDWMKGVLPEPDADRIEDWLWRIRVISEASHRHSRLLLLALEYSRKHPGEMPEKMLYLEGAMQAASDMLNELTHTALSGMKNAMEKT